MPQDRLLHPKLGHSQKVANLTDFEYRVWTQYLLSADDYGVMRASAVTLQADNDALAMKKSRIVERALEHVLTAGLVYAFEHQGRRYVYQRDWQEWQHIGYPRSTVNPLPPPEELAQCAPKTQKHFGLRLSNVSQILAESSTPSRARETATATATANGKGSETEGVQGKPVPPAREPIFANNGHRSHAACGRVCVPSFLHQEFRRALGGDETMADGRLRDWYTRVLNAIPDETAVDSDAPKFWRPRFQSTFVKPGGVQAVYAPRPEWTCPDDPPCEVGTTEFRCHQRHELILAKAGAAV